MERERMEGSSLGKQGEGEGQVAKKSHKALQKFLQEAQIILDQNQLLINEVNKNHESANPEDLGRNCGLIGSSTTTSNASPTSTAASSPH
ncbi:unnamed protein product [Spirodela intermedia]|uniref:Protein EARLY FLOWERING 4 domain-containing protein n=1 Tax=Spirodela intermedia TaxID=51605 RepID=A0A7I8ILA3_SPIIN|nr:unnamed protein product [Spirodela intermedia]CAA6658675.1 unnamed protein product [Spirodela intermedia]